MHYRTKYVFDCFVGVDASVVCVGVHMHVSLQLLCWAGSFVFLFSAVLLSLHLYYLYVTYFWVASLELPSQLESLIHCLLTSWSRQWWLKIKHSRTQLVFGQGWLYFPDSLEYEQCNHKIITNIAGWNSLSRWCWHSHFPGTWCEVFLHWSIWNHAPECGWSWRLL